MQPYKNVQNSFLYKLSSIFSSAQIILLSFLCIIIFGTILLLLPFASNYDTSLLDALFTATSATCVTGLSVVTTVAHWTLFGKIVILFLIQIGGLGTMTVAIFMLMILNRKISFRERLILQESMNQDRPSDILKVMKWVIINTFLAELVGSFFLMIEFIPEYGVLKGIGYSFFHSISAFCNAGFDLIGDQSFCEYVSNPLVNIVLILLITISGLGFSVWFDIFNVIKQHFKKSTKINKLQKKWHLSDYFLNCTLQTKIVLIVTAIMTIFGGILFFIFEIDNPETIANLDFSGKIFASLFQAVAPRTAGFVTIDLSKMHYASKFLYIIYMFIGGSPGGTAGGMKTVTVCIIFLAIISVIRGKDSIVAFNKKIPFIYLQKSLAVITIGLSIIVLATMLLTFTEKFTSSSYEFIDIIFEVTSAMGTTGSSLSFTASLSSIGRVIICFLMFIGRLGPMTIAIALTEKSQKNNNRIDYPEEKIIVG